MTNLFAHTEIDKFFVGLRRACRRCSESQKKWSKGKLVKSTPRMTWPFGAKEKKNLKRTPTWPTWWRDGNPQSAFPPVHSKLRNQSFHTWRHRKTAVSSSAPTYRIIFKFCFQIYYINPREERDFPLFLFP